MLTAAPFPLRVKGAFTATRPALSTFMLIFDVPDHRHQKPLRSGSSVLRIGCWRLVLSVIQVRSWGWGGGGGGGGGQAVDDSAHGPTYNYNPWFCLSESMGTNSKANASTDTASWRFYRLTVYVHTLTHTHAQGKHPAHCKWTELGIILCFTVYLPRKKAAVI